VQVIVTATGQKPVVAGKPEPPLHSEAVARSGARRPLVVGDRLDTDIEGAVRVGADSMLVLTGVTGPADAVLAPRHRRPTYLARDLAGLLGAHRAVVPLTQLTTAGDNEVGFRCGGWTTRLVPGGHGQPDADGRPATLEITGTGTPIDGLRALCAAAWSANSVTADSVLSAVARLSFPA
jgi:hypothetical protein